MPDEVTSERVKALAAAGRLSLDDAAAARIAHAIGPTVARVSQDDIAVSFETEPATFIAVARREVGR